jgi:chromosome segregation ATPase
MTMGYWYLLGLMGLLALGGVLLSRSTRALDRRISALEDSLASAREDLRRAHVRIDNQQRQLEALGKQLGWSDNHALTQVIPSPQTNP